MEGYRRVLAVACRQVLAVVHQQVPAVASLLDRVVACLLALEVGYRQVLAADYLLGQEVDCLLAQVGDYRQVQAEAYPVALVAVCLQGRLPTTATSRLGRFSSENWRGSVCINTRRCSGATYQTYDRPVDIGTLRPGTDGRRSQLNRSQCPISCRSVHRTMP